MPEENEKSAKNIDEYLDSLKKN